MKTLEEFFYEQNRRSLPCSAFSSPHGKLLSALRAEVRETANRGFAIFPVTELSRLTGQPDQLIGEATSDISRLEELGAMYPLCTWRAAVGPSGLCVVRMNALEDRAWFEAKCQDQGDCLTLTAVRGGTVWAIFYRPKGLVLRESAKRLTAGVRILGDGESFPVPPSPGCTWLAPWVEIEAVPYWLREFAFESPDNPPGKIVPVPSPLRRPAACRSTVRFDKPHRSTKKGFPTCNQAGWRAGFRVSRRR